MSFLGNLRESILKVRVVPKQTASDITTFTKEKDSLPNKMQDAVNSGKRIDLTDLLEITSLKGDRNKKYEIFEEMVADGRIGAAVEMYANDSVSYNSNGKVIWIESQDSQIVNYANKLLDDLNIDNNLWSYAYCLCLYGDVYLETFENTSYDDSKPTLLLEPVKSSPYIRTQKNIKGTKLERYIEKIPNPANVYDLQQKGKTCGYIRTEEPVQNSIYNNTYIYSGTVDKLDVLSSTKFVHICLSPNINRFPEKFTLVKEELIEKTDENGYIDGSHTEGSGESLSFTVKTGQSILENVYGPYQTLKLKEESVLLERVTKSSITRVIQVELGDLPESQKRKKLQELKNQIEQQLQMNKETGNIQSRAGAQPTENIIYTTTKNGKGAISTVNIGGDADLGNMEDIDQSEDKLYGSLLIPKALLGADMEGSGLSNGGSLTEMNATYARRIKRIQIALQNGIKDLINIFALSDGLDNVVNNFEVKLTPIITVEDNRRDELLQNKIRNVNDLLDILSKAGDEVINESTTLNIILDWMSKYLNQQDVVDIINERIKELDNEERDKTQEEQEKQISGDEEEKETTHSSSGSSFTPPMNKPDDMGTNNNETDDTKPNTPPDEESDINSVELANQENLADIEGQDLL